MQNDVRAEFDRRLFLHSSAENPILEGGSTSVICDITNSLEANIELVWWRTFEASSAQTLKTDFTVM